MSTYNTKRAKERGFTLVELSIVILIIGLLIAGIAAGTQMIRQAELRSIISDYYNFTIAYNNFQTKYKGVPGDLNVAAAYFPTNCVTGAATGCNGNGNGLIDYATGATNETNLAWQHLALGKVLGGSFALVTRSSPATVVGSNAPQSKRIGVGYVLINESTLPASSPAAVFDLDKNVIFLGKANTGSTDTLVNGALTPEDAFNIDQKMDDGYADNQSVSGSTIFRGIDSGVVRGKNGNDFNTGTNVCLQVTGGFNGYNIAGLTVTACRLGASVN